MLKFVFLLLTSTILLNSYSTPCLYDNCLGIYNDMYIVEKDNETICVDENNKKIMRFDFLDTPGISLENDSYYFKYNNNLFINNLNSQIVYDSDSTYIKGLKVVKSNGYYGIVNIKNEIIIPFEYDEIYFSEDCFRAKKKGEYYLINKNNEIILMQDKEKNNPEIVKNGDLYALIKDEEIILPFSKDKLEFLTSETVRRGNEMSFSPNELYDITGQKIIEKADNVNVFAVYGKEILIRDIKTNKMGVINKEILINSDFDIKESITIPIEFDFLYKPRSEYDIYYFIENDKNGLIIKGIKKTYSYEFDVEKITDDGYILGKIKNSNNKKIVFNPDGIPLIFTDAKALYYYNNSLLINTIEGKFIILSL